MRSMSARSRTGTTNGAGRRRVTGVCCVVLGLAALLVPAGSAAGEGSSPSVVAPVAEARGSGLPQSQTSSVEADITRVLRSSPGAVRTGRYEVSWDGGAVVSTWAPSSVPASSDRTGTQRLSTSGDEVETSLTSGYAGCPDGTTVHWYCFYEHASYGGRMLQFRDCPSTQSLGYYGFANATTSWVNNRSGVTITVYDGSTSGTVLWREYGRSHDDNVGSWANDRADTFTCRT
jgi:Peptidase inhibitor family I36